MAGTRPSSDPAQPSTPASFVDMDSFFDFNQGTTNQSPTTSKHDTMASYMKGPSHNYSHYKQQVGVVPTGGMGAFSNTTNADNGIYESYGGMDFNNAGMGWNTGLEDIDGDLGMDFSMPTAMPAMFYPDSSNEAPLSNFIDPSNLNGRDEPASNVGKLWPGMHQQQAQQMAMAKAVQQRNIKMQTQFAHQRQHSNASTVHPTKTSQPTEQAPLNGHASASTTKRASHVTEPHVEESISRLLNQMRQNSNVSDDAESNPDDSMPHMGRMRKDEEDMDEDERLLASEEGKKLSSKERRQLRNKVSARAFRSRRKEYISQLEGEVALKVQECNITRAENRSLRQENDRYRVLIETMLRHPAYTSFITDLAQDPTLIDVPLHSANGAQISTQASLSRKLIPQPTQTPQQPITPASSLTPVQQDVKPAFLMNFDPSQLQIPQQQSQPQSEPSQQIGMAMVPEMDFHKLDLNNFGRTVSNNFSVNAYAITTLPPGPDPVDLLADMSSYAPVPLSANADLNVLLAKLDGAARRVRSST